MSNFQILLPDDATAATALAFAATAGVATGSQIVHCWYRKGLGGTTAKNVSLQIEVYDSSSGTWKTSDLEPLDRYWFGVRVIGFANAGGDTLFAPQTTGWTALGSDRRLLLNDFTPDSARYVEIRVRPPLDEGAATASFTWRLVPSYDDTVLPVSEGLPYVAWGILTGVGDGSLREWISRPAPVTHGTDTIEIPIRDYLWDGDPLSEALTSLTFNADDVASAALATGEEYQALVYQPASGAALVIKGAKAVAGASVSPTLPADTLAAAIVRVPYGLAITDANVTVLATAGRFAVREGIGLTAIVGAGRALLPGALVRHSDETPVSVADNADTYLWVESAGVVSATLTEASPDVGAAELAKVTAVSGVITAIVDKRKFWSIPTVDSTATSANVPDTVVKRDGSGAFAGSLTGTADDAANVGAVTAAQVVASVGATLAATDAATPTTIVERDGAGSFAGNEITANGHLASPHVISTETTRIALGSTGAANYRDTNCQVEDITLDTGALFTDSSDDLLLQWGLIECVTMEILSNITGPAGTISVGDTSNPVRFAGPIGVLTAGTVWAGGDHNNASPPTTWQAAPGKIRLTFVGIPTGGVVRVRAWQRFYGF